MLEGFTENELANYANECREEYAEKLKNIWKKAFDGEIKGYDELDKALRDFDNDFFYRMDDYTDDFVSSPTEEERNSLSDVRETMPYEEFVAKWYHWYHAHWEDERGRPIDGCGNLLTADGKHSVWEVIKGGK